MVDVNVVNFLTIGLMAIAAIALVKWGLKLAGQDGLAGMI